MCHCDRYDFQATQSGIWYYRNQRVWVENRVSFSRKLINLGVEEDFSVHRENQELTLKGMKSANLNSPTICKEGIDLINV